MRSGVLLAEESPQTLLSMYGLSSLEDVFLELCMKGQLPPDDRLAEKDVAPSVQTISDDDNAASADDGDSTKENSTKENSTKENSTKENSTKENSTKENSTQENSTQENSTKENHSENSSKAGDTTSICGSTSALKRCAYGVPSAHRTAALIRKNFLQTFRNIG